MNYKKYKYNVREKLKQSNKYNCEKNKSICKRDKCSDYESCHLPAKLNYENWRDAFVKGNKEEMKRLMGG